MNREKLIKALQKLPEDVEVVIFDNRRNLSEDSGDGSSAGIYSDFEIVMLTKKSIPDKTIPFAILSFDNDDYDNNGNKLE